jgi:hypothetical protein
MLGDLLKDVEVKLVVIAAYDRRSVGASNPRIASKKQFWN